MTREELKGKQTPGEISSGQRTEWNCSSGGAISLNAPDWSGLAHVYQHCSKERYKTEGEANAALYAEAHNAANRTGMWPEDMVARIKELEGALASEVEAHEREVKLTRSIARVKNLGGRIKAARAVLNKTTA